MPFISLRCITGNTGKRLSCSRMHYSRKQATVWAFVKIVIYLVLCYVGVHTCIYSQHDQQLQMTGRNTIVDTTKCNEKLHLFLKHTYLVDSDTFIHSFRLFLQRIFKSSTTQRRSRHSTDTVPEFHAEAPQANVSERLASGPYVAVRAGVEPMTFRTKGVDSTNTPPSPDT